MAHDQEKGYDLTCHGDMGNIQILDQGFIIIGF
jgi:hypothetical protein